MTCGRVMRGEVEGLKGLKGGEGGNAEGLKNFRGKNV
jgi:hypothetical protein